MKTKMIFVSTFCLVLCLVFSTSSSADTLNVPGDYTTIQAAINDASDGDVVSVAAGTYSGPGNKNLDFYGKAITVESVSGPAATIIDCEGVGRGFYFGNEGSDSVLSGFTITNGYVDEHGGGIYIENASPTIIDCIITSNRANEPDSGGFGGGIFCYNFPPLEAVQNLVEYIEMELSLPNRINRILIRRLERIKNSLEKEKKNAAIRKLNRLIIFIETQRGKTITDQEADTLIAEAQFVIRLINSPSPTIANCTITNNRAWDNETGGSGGGIYLWNSSPTISNCNISDNIAYAGAGIQFGGSSPIITDCTITNNWAIDGGGGITSGGDSFAHISECDISGNSALYGAGIVCYDNTSTIVENCNITGNTATGGAGSGISCNEIATPIITNCTISNNDFYSGPTSFPTLTNCILWGENSGIEGTPIVTYSNIQDAYPGTGNINIDPQFVGGGDYHLTSGSPCIDTGTSVGAPDIDIDGDLRPQGGGYDMGSDEYI